jgi:hypothetical protein
VQAPKRRDQGPGAGAAVAGLPSWALLAGGIVAVAVIAGIAFVAFSGGKSSAVTSLAVKKAMLAAGCSDRNVKPLPPTKDPTGIHGGYHEDSPTLASKVKWSTSPPSGGGHYPEWAVWGFYDSVVNPRQVVHNEEHGGVIIWFGPKVPAATIAELHNFYDEDGGVGMFGTEYPSLGSKIALTAWTGLPTGSYYVKGDYGIGHLAICSNFNLSAFRTFRDAYRGHGPETTITLADDHPGM